MWKQEQLKKIAADPKISPDLRPPQVPLPQFVQCPGLIYGLDRTWTRHNSPTRSANRAPDQIVFSQYVSEFCKSPNLCKRTPAQEHRFAYYARVFTDEIRQGESIDNVGIELQAL